VVLSTMRKNVITQVLYKGRLHEWWCRKMGSAVFPFLSLETSTDNLGKVFESSFSVKMAVIAISALCVLLFFSSGLFCPLTSHETDSSLGGVSVPPSTPSTPPASLSKRERAKMRLVQALTAASPALKTGTRFQDGSTPPNSNLPLLGGNSSVSALLRCIRQLWATQIY